ncbi:Atxe2 family lasso peptide isopeptidase [Stenotrophomonas mori]|uniref:Atxe2 family lasso peptide isopeptidase n=1 Tax=Stenotrophomonas mori TaxID=2871096 RepID=A0ABT0SIR3_9GAMM|nr:Atxe2 family lasso peptide isopeptidase [Stenotrophomonas mori]MCL7714973.1 Atxe2 family lasso peptide isopeptidase [Stenotrophomonas mori]
MMCTSSGRAWLLLLVVQGVLPWKGHAGVIASQRLVEVINLSAPTVSPDGRYVAFRAEQASIDRDRNESTWYVQAIEGTSPPRKLGDGGFPLRNSSGLIDHPQVVWSPDSAAIYYLASIDQQLDVWRAAIDGREAERVTRDPGDVRDFVVSRDGRRLKYSVGAARAEVEQAERDAYESGVRLDAQVPVVGALVHSSRTRGRASSPRYSNLGYDRRAYLWDAPDRWKEIDLQTGVAHEIAAPGVQGTAREWAIPEGTAAPLGVEREPDSGRVALLLPARDSHNTQLAGRGDLAVMPHERSGTVVRCPAKACLGSAIATMRWRPGTDDLLFTVIDQAHGRRQSVFRWNVRSNEVAPVVSSDGLLNGGRGNPVQASSGRQAPCGVTREVMVCVAAEANRPPRLERIGIESGLRHVLHAPNAALDSDLQKTVSARLLRWTSDEGRAFSGYLLEARNRVPVRSALFINYYSCDGFLQGGGMGDEWPAPSLATAGISALCINALPYNVDPLIRYHEGADAVGSVVRRLAAEGRIDPARVGMGGLSFGSEVALWTTMKSSLLATVSLASPFGSPLWYTLASLRGEAALSAMRGNWGLGAPDETPEQWRTLSPAYNLDRIRVPVLFQMAEEEYGYALDYVIPLVRTRRAEAYVFPDEAHNKFLPRHKAAVYQRNLDWFRFWLLDAEDRVPAKAAQYRRWRAMKDAAADRAADVGGDPPAEAG